MVSFLLVWGAERIILVQVWYEKYSAILSFKGTLVKVWNAMLSFNLMILGKIKIFIKNKGCRHDEFVGKNKDSK